MTILAEKNLWSVKETAARLGVSERTLHTHTAPRGTLKCVKIGVRIGYRPKTVEAWLEERESIEATKGTDHKEAKGEQEPEASSDC